MFHRLGHLAVGILLLSAVALFAQAPPAVKNIVLVHDAFADSSSRLKLIPVLEPKDYYVVAAKTNQH